MDARLKDLERRVDREPTDVEAVRALVMGLVRVGDAATARRWAARALVADAPGVELIDALRAADAPMRALPFGDRHALVASLDDQALKLAPLAFEKGTFGQETRAEVDGDLIIGVTHEVTHGDRVVVLRLADGLPALPGSPFSLPPGLDALAVTAVGSALFVAGKRNDLEREPATALLARRDLRRPDDGWDILHLPADACGWGKAVDALLVIGDRLVAVDDIVMPKWFFAFDVADPFAARLVESRELPWHTTYEHVTDAVLGPAGVALLSGGANHGTISQFATLYDAGSLVERCCVSTHVRYDEPRDRWHDLAVTRDLLVVASEQRGLVGLDLREPLPARVDGATLRPAAELSLAPNESVRRLAMIGPDRAIASIANSSLADGLVQRYATVTLALR